MYIAQDTPGMCRNLPPQERENIKDSEPVIVAGWADQLETYLGLWVALNHRLTQRGDHAFR